MDSFYEEVLVALFLGLSALAVTGKRALILIGGLLGVMGWAVGLILSEHLTRQQGIGIGPWLLTSALLFSIAAYTRFKRKRAVIGIAIFICGIFIGILIEIIQLLPAFIYLFKFMDFQAFAIMSSFLLIVPLVNVLTATESNTCNQ